MLASTSCGWNDDPLTSSLLSAPVRRAARRRGRQAGFYGPGTEEDFSLLRLHWQLRQAYRPSLRGLRLGLVAAWTWTSRPWLHTLDLPVLVLHGSDDAVVPVANGRVIASTVPDGRLEVYRDAGHLAVLRESTRTAGLVRDFLRTT